MKKSTKIILIASGTVILVSVILIIVLAYMIKAAPNVVSPQPGSTHYKCKDGATGKITGIKLKMNASDPQPVQGDQYKSVFNIQLINTEEFSKWPITNLDIKHYYIGYSIIRTNTPMGSVASGQITDYSKPIESTIQYTLKPGEKIFYRVDATICWLGKSESVNPYDLYTDYVQNIQTENNIIVSRPSDGSKPTIQNPTQESGTPLPPSSSSGSDEICDCPKLLSLTTLKQGPLASIICETRCGTIKAMVWGIQSAFNMMTHYSGLDQNEYKLPTTE